MAVPPTGSVDKAIYTSFSDILRDEKRNMW